jgi:hypothetical protein
VITFEKEKKARDKYVELTYSYAKILYHDGRVFERPAEKDYDWQIN